MAGQKSLAQISDRLFVASHEEVKISLQFLKIVEVHKIASKMFLKEKMSKTLLEMLHRFDKKITKTYI